MGIATILIHRIRRKLTLERFCERCGAPFEATAGESVCSGCE